jgi:hypothetical protein
MHASAEYRVPCLCAGGSVHPPCPAARLVAHRRRWLSRLPFRWGGSRPVATKAEVAEQASLQPS